jgi:hypothetical protein
MDLFLWLEVPVSKTDLEKAIFSGLKLNKI